MPRRARVLVVSRHAPCSALSATRGRVLKTWDNRKGVHAMLRCRNGWSIDARVFALVVVTAKGGARQAEIRRVTDELFDFHEMSRRMLGARWQEGSEPEQEEFVRLRSREAAGKAEQGQ